MSEMTLLDKELVVGRELSISFKTPRGISHLRSVVTYIGQHHFRTKLLDRIPPDILTAGQQVKIRFIGETPTLPLKAKYLRGNDLGSDVLVISIPEGDWLLNRRSFVRVPIVLRVEIRRTDRATPIPAVTANLSGGGALLQVIERLDLGETIQIVIYVDDGKGSTIGFTARVVREIKISDTFYYGVQFVQANPRDQNRICKIVIVRQFEDRREELRELTKEK